MVIVKIPRRVTKGPNESVATSFMFFPKTPTNVAVNKMYKIIGIDAPRMIAFLKNFSLPFISCLSSGIEVNPSKAKRVTPIGRKKFFGFIVDRLFRFICGRK